MKKLSMAVIPLFAGFLFAQSETTTTTTKTTWSGALVDEGCQTKRTKETTTNTSDERSTQTTRTTTEVVECPVTTATSSFGLMTPDGKFIRFDPASNARIIEMVKSNKDWNNYMSSHKPIKVHVIGTAKGDVVVMESIRE